MGAGAGQAIEDGWVLSKSLRDHLTSGGEDNFATLEKSATFYQSVRLPRAQKVQKGSRIAGATYDMQLEGMEDKSFEECLPILKQTTIDRQKFVWEEDLDEAYENAKKQVNGSNGTTNGR